MFALVMCIVFHVIIGECTANPITHAPKAQQKRVSIADRSFLFSVRNPICDPTKFINVGGKCHRIYTENVNSINRV